MKANFRVQIEKTNRGARAYALTNSGNVQKCLWKSRTKTKTKTKQTASVSAAACDLGG